MWTEVATGGEPESDLSGNVTVFWVYDGDQVQLCGRLNDRWLERAAGPINVTHWRPLEPPAAPGE